MDMNEIMKMAGQMREQMESVQEEAEKLRVQGESGGGMVKVEMNGRYEIVSVTIDPAIVVPDQVNFVEDWHNVMIGLDRLIDVGKCLRLDTLRAVNHQKRAFNRAH